MRCWLATTLNLDACDGRLDKAHLGFSKTWLLHSPTGPHLTADEANDPALLRPICRAHHHALDYGSLFLTREQLPASVERFAREHNLEHKLDRDYGPR